MRRYIVTFKTRGGDLVTKCTRAESFNDAMYQFLQRDHSLVMPITAVIRP